MYKEIADEFMKMSENFVNEVPLEEYLYIIGMCVGRISKKCAPNSWEVIKCLGDGVEETFNDE